MLFFLSLDLPSQLYHLLHQHSSSAEPNDAEIVDIVSATGPSVQQT
jgi:hypothetical protein